MARSLLPRDPWVSIKIVTNRQVVHLIMASQQEPNDPEAGPSGLSVQEMLSLLGLDASEDEDDPPNPEVDEPSLTCEEVWG